MAAISVAADRVPRKFIETQPRHGTFCGDSLENESLIVDENNLAALWFEAKFDGAQFF
jgi:hypothetical protein